MISAMSPPSNLRHLNKRRAPTPVKRRPPSKKGLLHLQEDASLKVPRPVLTLPELQQIGDEIIV